MHYRLIAYFCAFFSRFGRFVKGQLTVSLYTDRGDRYSYMQCPKCSTEMLLKQRHETSIDYCPSCGGVWLDRGEIDKLIQVQSSYEDEHYKKYHYRNGDYDDYYYNNKYGRRGFFGDFFNF